MNLLKNTQTDQPEQALGVTVLCRSGKVLLVKLYSPSVHRNPGTKHLALYVNSQPSLLFQNILSHGYWKTRPVIMTLFKIVCLV